MADHAPTLDPKTRIPSVPGARVPDVPILRILYHGDLSRIGAETTEGALVEGLPVPVGRRGPAFTGRDGGLAALDDPCVSRHQLTARWHAGDRTLSVTPAPGSRRAVFVGFDRRPADGRPLPPGTLIEIEDRVLLWFTLAPLDRAGRDPMGLVGESEAMTALRLRIATLAPAASTVLVHGETGAGKELVVRALHARGPRPDGPLVALNCGAVPESLMESELFGHERGAFTGADRARAGLFEQASGGTLFLDEIGELPPAMQAGLLRVLQERRVRRVGGAEERAVDVRVVAATHRDLAAEVAAGRFREDLYARIERPDIRVPPLRERPEDVPLLLATFLAAERDRRRASARLRSLWQPVGVERSPLPCDYVRALMQHRWPRNVRELCKLAEDAALCLEAGAPLAPPPEAPPPPAPSRADAEPAAGRPGEPTTAPMRIADAGRPACRELAEVLRGHRYSPSAAARELGVARNTVYAWMADCGLPQATDYAPAALEAAVADAGGDLTRAADRLRISLRALKLRLAALDADAADDAG